MEQTDPIGRPRPTPVRGHAREHVDIHCHCLPGMDDGPATLAESLALCRELAADGITTVVATPHQLGRYDARNSAQAIRAAVSDLDKALAAEGLPLRVLPGADVRIDERIPGLVARDEVMTVADGGRYLLLELPNEAPINPVRLARELASMGITVILTHPERCEPVCRNSAQVLEWIEEGICLQLTAASILGAFGPLAQEACWHWLGTGAASLVASDSHGGGRRRPCMSPAFTVVGRRFGWNVARRVCIENPLRVLRGEGIAIPAALHTEMRP